MSRTAYLSVSLRGRSPRQSAATRARRQARQRGDLLRRAGTAEEVGEVGLRGPPGVTHQLAEGRGLALHPRVEVREVVGVQAVAVALGLPDARRPVDRGRVVEDRQDVLGERAAHPHRIAHALPGHGVLEVPGVAGQRPARPGRGAEEGRRLAGRAQFRVGARVEAGDPARRGRGVRRACAASSPRDPCAPR